MPPSDAPAPPAPPAAPKPAEAALPGRDPDAPRGRRDVAVVLTQTRKVVVGQHTYHVPAGQVIRLLQIAVDQHFSDGHDTQVVDAGELKLGDTVPSSEKAA